MAEKPIEASEPNAAEIQLYDEKIFDVVLAELTDIFQEIEKDPRLNFQNWYLRELKRIDADRETVKAMAKAMLRKLDSKEATLVWRYGLEFKQRVQQDIDLKPKGKGMTYFYGRAGFRSSAGGKLYVTDEAAAIAWAEKNCLAAIHKEIRTTPLQDGFKAGDFAGVVPAGCDLSKPKESFSPVTDYRTLKMAQTLRAHFGLEEVDVTNMADSDQQLLDVQPPIGADEANANNAEFRRT